MVKNADSCTLFECKNSYKLFLKDYQNSGDLSSIKLFKNQSQIQKSIESFCEDVLNCSTVEKTVQEEHSATNKAKMLQVIDSDFNSVGHFKIVPSKHYFPPVHDNFRFVTATDNYKIYYFPSVKQEFKKEKSKEMLTKLKHYIR